MEGMFKVNLDSNFSCYILNFQPNPWVKCNSIFKGGFKAKGEPFKGVLDAYCCYNKVAQI